MSASSLASARSVSALAIRSTTKDMLLFAAANLHPERGPLGPAAALAQRERASAGNPNTGIGLNWIIRKAATAPIVWHNGGTAGYRTFLGLVPSKHMAVVVLTNSGGAGADDIGFHFLDSTIPLAPGRTSGLRAGANDSSDVNTVTVSCHTERHALSSVTR